MPGEALSFPIDKVQQFIVQFAHRVPVRKQLTSGEKKALENLLRELDPEFFQLFDESSMQNPACLLQVLCQHPVDAAQITLPSFVLSNDSFSFIHPVRVLGKYISGHHSLDTSSQNAKTREWSFKVQEAVSNLRCQRAGKIYELVLGPFSADQKKELFKDLFSDSFDFKEAGEANLTFAYYREFDGTTYNIQTALNYMQQSLENIFLLNVRVDINNRQLKQSMEPPQVEKVWNRADALLGGHLESILNIR